MLLGREKNSIIAGRGRWAMTGAIVLTVWLVGMPVIRKFGRALLRGFWWLRRDMVCESAFYFVLHF